MSEPDANRPDGCEQSCEFGCDNSTTSKFTEHSCFRVVRCAGCNYVYGRGFRYICKGFDLYCNNCRWNRCDTAPLCACTKYELAEITAALQKAGDEWRAKFEQLRALKDCDLPRPALELIAQELGVKYWELSW